MVGVWSNPEGSEWRLKRTPYWGEPAGFSFNCLANWETSDMSIKNKTININKHTVRKTLGHRGRFDWKFSSALGRISIAVWPTRIHLWIWSLWIWATRSWMKKPSGGSEDWWPNFSGWLMILTVMALNSYKWAYFMIYNLSYKLYRSYKSIYNCYKGHNWIQPDLTDVSSVGEPPFDAPCDPWGNSWILTICRLWMWVAGQKSLGSGELKSLQSLRDGRHSVCRQVFFSQFLVLKKDRWIRARSSSHFHVNHVMNPKSKHVQMVFKWDCPNIGLPSIHGHFMFSD